MKPAHKQPIHAQNCTITDYQHTPIDPSAPIVIGVDEVGRGSLFGQMTVAATILPAHLTGLFETLTLTNTPLSALNDSKKLTAKQRQQLYTNIHTLCVSYVLVDIPACVIDDINIYQATLLGMRLAIERLIDQHKPTPQKLHILIDGNAKPQLGDTFYAYEPCINTLIKGDGKHSAIACASILAKVHRDEAMIHYAKHYPDYQLDKHKGYASQAHLRAIATHGILKEHRKSFNPMRQMLAQHKPSQGDLF